MRAGTPDGLTGLCLLPSHGCLGCQGPLGLSQFLLFLARPPPPTRPCALPLSSARLVSGRCLLGMPRFALYAAGPEHSPDLPALACVLASPKLHPSRPQSLQDTLLSGLQQVRRGI